MRSVVWLCCIAPASTYVLDNAHRTKTSLPAPVRVNLQARKQGQKLPILDALDSPYVPRQAFCDSTAQLMLGDVTCADRRGSLFIVHCLWNGKTFSETRVWEDHELEKYEHCPQGYLCTPYKPPPVELSLLPGTSASGATPSAARFKRIECITARLHPDYVAARVYAKRRRDSRRVKGSSSALPPVAMSTYEYYDFFTNDEPYRAPPREDDDDPGSWGGSLSLGSIRH